MQMPETMLGTPTIIPYQAKPIDWEIWCPNRPSRTPIPLVTAATASRIRGTPPLRTTPTMNSASSRAGMISDIH